MATLFTDLLARLGPSQLASRLNITQRTARNLRFAPLSRFPRVTANARTLTKNIKTSILNVAGMSRTEALRHVGGSFAQVESVKQRLTAMVDTIARNSIEFKADRIGMSTGEFLSSFPDEVDDLRSSIRGGIRVSDKRLGNMEQDSV